MEPTGANQAQVSNSISEDITVSSNNVQMGSSLYFLKGLLKAEMNGMASMTGPKWGEAMGQSVWMNEKKSNINT